MTGLLPCICPHICQAEAGCYRPPRFQVRLAAVQRTEPAPVRRHTAVCTTHLAAMVQAMTAWAREHELADGDLTVLTIDPPDGPPHPGRPARRGRTETPGLVFSTIRLTG